MRDNKVSIFDGNKFVLVDKKETFDKLYDDKADAIEIKYDELKHDLPRKTLRKIERFIKDKDVDKHKISIIKNIDLLTYNNRNIPLKTKKSIKTIS